ncbi:unnamed protein product [Orchesella dallaii]|uniref:SP-RING-type domain-containing protein n=1 Tax=Orchesella dallaii TaxID=48710 RepID=A0ABP1RCD4_9HEXA
MMGKSYEFWRRVVMSFTSSELMSVLNAADKTSKSRTVGGLRSNCLHLIMFGNAGVLREVMKMQQQKIIKQQEENLANGESSGSGSGLQLQPEVRKIHSYSSVAMNFGICNYLEEGLTLDELFQKLQTERIRPADFTRAQVMGIFKVRADEEGECAPTYIRVSIACPMGKERMTWPCRAVTCAHLQCFDANQFLLMNRKNPKFRCPVCNNQLKFDDLRIDGYILDVVQSLSKADGNDIELFADGKWAPASIAVKDEQDKESPPKKRAENSALAEVADLDDRYASDKVSIVEIGNEKSIAHPARVSFPTVLSSEVCEVEKLLAEVVDTVCRSITDVMTK